MTVREVTSVALRRLHFLVTITRSNSVGTTTRHLCATRSGVSGTIGDLRRRLRLRVFAHSDHNIALAGSNARLLNCTHRIMRRTSVLRTHCRSNNAPRTHLTVSTRRCTFSIRTFIGIIRHYHSDGFRFVVHRAAASRVVSSIHTFHDSVNVLCLSSFGTHILRGTFTSTHTDFRPLFSTAIRIFIDRHRPLTHHPRLSLTSLAPCAHCDFRRKASGSFCCTRRPFDCVPYSHGVQVSSHKALAGLLVASGNCALSANILSGRVR